MMLVLHVQWFDLLSRVNQNYLTAVAYNFPPAAIWKTLRDERHHHQILLS
jgi:hypothetical protein